MKFAFRHIVFALPLFAIVACASPGVSGKGGRSLFSLSTRDVQPAESSKAYTHYIYGLMLARENKLDEATKELKAAAEYDPGAARIHTQLSRIYLRTQELYVLWLIVNQIGSIWVKSM